jgi:hypothetical protein
MSLEKKFSLYLQSISNRSKFASPQGLRRDPAQLIFGVCGKSDEHRKQCACGEPVKTNKHIFNLRAIQFRLIINILYF